MAVTGASRILRLGRLGAPASVPPLTRPPPPRPLLLGCHRRELSLVGFPHVFVIFIEYKSGPLTEQKRAVFTLPAGFAKRLVLRYSSIRRSFVDGWNVTPSIRCSGQLHRMKADAADLVGLALQR